MRRGAGASVADLGLAHPPPKMATRLAPPPGPSPQLERPSADQALLASLSLTTLLDSPGSTAAAAAALIFLCCCCFCIAANRCAAGRDAGGDAHRGRRGPTRRARTAAYSGVAASGEDYEDDYGEDGYVDDEAGDVPAVRVVRVGSKHPPARMGGRGGARYA